VAAALGICSAATAADGVRAAFLRERFPEGVMRWGGDAEGGAPFQLRDPADPSHVIGFEVDLADALAETLSRHHGVPLVAQFVQYEWETLPLGLAGEDFDCVISGLEITPENEESIRFSRPYYIYAQQLVVRAGEDEIAAFADVRGQSVGTLSGSAAERMLQRAGAGEIVSYSGQVEPYLDLELGRVDAVLLDLPIAIYYASDNEKLKFTGDLVGQGAYGIGLRPADTELAAALDEALGELIADGRLRQIYRRWQIWNAKQALLARGDAQAEELAGLGFDGQGDELRPDEPLPADQVDTAIMAQSAQRWTFGQYATLLVQAAGMTVLLTVCSMALAMALGLVVSLCRMYAPPPLPWLALAYIELFRGIPLLLLLFFLYFGVPEVGNALAATLGAALDWLIPNALIEEKLFAHPAVMTAILGFGMNYAAYEAEIYRSSIGSVPVGQWEAGRALGMRDTIVFRRIIFPQAFRTALGPMTNDFVAMFKDTSLVSVIAVRELTKEYLILARSSFEFVKLGLLTAALYLAMSVPLGYLSRWLEKRWGPGK
jgi:polar amino acid transport system substrate-binding protein